MKNRTPFDAPIPILKKRPLIQKYKNLLPDDFLKLWRTRGFASLLNGYLRMINPDDYQEFLKETYFRGSVSIPVFATAFGDIMTLEDGKYIGLIKYKNGESHIISSYDSRFFWGILEDDYFQNKNFEIPKYEAALERLGPLKQDECYGYVPMLCLGGPDSLEHLKIVKMREHLAIMTQFAGGIGV